MMQQIARRDTGYSLLFGRVATVENPAQSQIEHLKSQIEQLFSHAGLRVRTTYVQYGERYIQIGIDLSGDGHFHSDQATTAIRTVRNQLQRLIGRRCHIAAEERQGTVWMETDG